MALQDGSRVHRDEHNRVRILNHNSAPFAARGSESPQELGQNYIREAAPLYDIPDAQLRSLGLATSRSVVEEDAAFRIEVERKAPGSLTIAYAQTYFGLPVWEAALNVVIQEQPLQVLSSSSTAYHGIEVKRPSTASLARAERLSARELPRLLFDRPRAGQAGPITVNGRRLRVYRYDAAKRVADPGEQAKGGFERSHPRLPLPAVPDRIKEGSFYVVVEVLFSMAVPGWWTLNWRALIEVETRAVLYLRALVA